MKTKKITQFILIAGVVILVLAALYKCPYDYIFGISCPGCGMTRAFLALLRFDFAGAFYYHPLFPVVLLVGIYFLLDWLKIFRLTSRQKTICLWLICGLFFLVYFIRLFSGSAVVTIDIEHSLLGRFLKKLSEFLHSITT